MGTDPFSKRFSQFLWSDRREILISLVLFLSYSARSAETLHTMGRGDDCKSISENLTDFEEVLVLEVYAKSFRQI
jgi:hypothetical protein